MLDINDIAKKSKWLEGFSWILLELAEEMALSLRGSVEDDRAGVERGARAISSLLRANMLLGAITENCTKDSDGAQKNSEDQNCEPDSKIVRSASAGRLYQSSQSENSEEMEEE